MAKSSGKSNLPLWSRMLVGVSVGGLLVWSAIAALKLVLEFLFARLRLLRVPLSTRSFAETATTFVALPLLGLGMLATVVAVCELMLDIAASKSKPGAIARRPFPTLCF